MAKELLSAKRVQGLRTKGRYHDGGGLYLQVTSPESRSWLYRYSYVCPIESKSKGRWIGLGSADSVTLAEAREKASEMRSIRAKGLDPLHEKNDALRRKLVAEVEREAREITFEQAAEEFLGVHLLTLESQKHRDQYRSTLKTYAYPHFGHMPIAKITTRHINDALGQLWLEKNETASRVLQRVRMVFDRQLGLGTIEGDNPASMDRMKRVLPGGGRANAEKHFAAMPWREVAPFVGALKREVSLGALALRFTILTMCRTGEVLGALWSEFDFEANVWTIPAERTKVSRAHRVPLTPEMRQVLEAAEAWRLRSNPHVFPGERKGKSLSNMAMLMMMRRFELPYTVHGFRSTARDWMSEETHYPREVCEAALAHAVENSVEAAYRRSDLFERRRSLMADWSLVACAEAVPLALPEKVKDKALRKPRVAAMAAKE